MKKHLILLIVGMIIVVIGALLKINGNDLSHYILIIGLTIEMYVLASLVIQSLKK
jgi:flagellar biosynthesis protein FliQ